MLISTLNDLLAAAIAQVMGQCGPNDNDFVGAAAAASFRTAVKMRGGITWLLKLEAKGAKLKSAAATAIYSL